MIIGLGIDIVNIPRFQKVIQETPSFTKRIFSEGEQKNSINSLAGRFAAKEAFLKSLKGSLQIKFMDIEIVGQHKAPTFKIDLNKYPDLSNLDFELSISHHYDYAIATVLSSRKIN
jgi:holo-[acyl-carrier protein] synthase